jgi:hypothetical protein
MGHRQILSTRIAPCVIYVEETSLAILFGPPPVFSGFKLPWCLKMNFNLFLLLKLNFFTWNYFFNIFKSFWRASIKKNLNNNNKNIILIFFLEKKYFEKKPLPHSQTSVIDPSTYGHTHSCKTIHWTDLRQGLSHESR